MQQRAQGDQWQPGDAPSQALRWCVVPIGKAMNKSLTLQMGNCNHRKYIPRLLQLVRTGAVDPTEIITQVEPLADVVDAYESFDRRENGWLKVELDVAAH